MRQSRLGFSLVTRSLSSHPPVLKSDMQLGEQEIGIVIILATLAVNGSGSTSHLLSFIARADGVSRT